MLLEFFYRWREQRLLRNNRIPARLWERVTLDALRHFHLDQQELDQLRDLSSLFLLRKKINGAGGLEVDDYMRVVIASQACLLILELDLDYYDGWIEIIVYPDSFIVTREERDEIGVIHTKRSVLGGEAWGRGPLVLSWQGAQPRVHLHGPDSRGRVPHGLGSNVILHEFAHKLDMFDGYADGTPILHPDMRLQDWVKIFTAAYDHLREDIEDNTRTSIDPYAAEKPAEFFAVVTEEFFEVPERLHRYHPNIYEQLRLFYRQDPLQRQIKALEV